MPYKNLDKILPEPYVRLTTYCRMYEIPYNLAYTRCVQYVKVPYKRFGGSLCISKLTDPGLFLSPDPVHNGNTKSKFARDYPESVRDTLEEILKRTP